MPKGILLAKSCVSTVHLILTKLSNKCIKACMNIQNGSIVEYQQNSKSIIGIIIGANKDKSEVFNETGNTLFLPANRLFVLGQASEEVRRDSVLRLSFLKNLISEVQDAAAVLNLEMAWEIFSEAGRQIEEAEICELFFTNPSPARKLAVHRLLIDDKVFFKRDKSGVLFEARPPAIVEELKKKQVTEALKLKAQERLIEAIIAALSNKSGKIELPPEIVLLEQYAALGSKASSYKNAVFVLEEVQKRSKLALGGRGEEKAFALLVKIGHFHKDENLSLYKVGRYTKFDPELENAAQELIESYGEHFATDAFSDLTGLDIFSIDSVETKDIDDALSLERLDDNLRIGVHITDVASFILPGTSLFEEALFRASSLYFPEQKVHMLPQKLSEKACSLVEGKERYAITFFLYVNDSGDVIKREIVRSRIIVKSRLDYNSVDSFLVGAGLAPARGGEVGIERLKPILCFLSDFAKNSELKRVKAGALVIQRRDMQPVLLGDGRIGLTENNDDTPAKKLVSELMVQANLTAALFAGANNLPIIYRSQEAPETDPKTLALDVPEGTARSFLQCAVMKKSMTGVTPLPHVGLGLEAYAQATSPIRRAGDLINQRQIISFIKDGIGYFSAQEVLKLSGRIDESLIDARTLQRERNRYWLLKYIIQEGVTEIEGTVMKTEGVKNPLVELDEIFLIWNFIPLGAKHRPGDRIKLKIKKIDPDELVMRLVEL